MPDVQFDEGMPTGGRFTSTRDAYSRRNDSGFSAFLIRRGIVADEAQATVAGVVIAIILVVLTVFIGVYFNKPAHPPVPASAIYR